MNNSRLISVIVPIYNAEKYIERSIKSILDQTHQNFEIICIDDASTDNSALILSEFARSDGRVKILRNKVNSGISKSLNYGVESAKGDILARMDADDEALPSRLEKQLNYLLENNYDLIGSTVIYITDDGIRIGASKYLNDIEVCSALNWKSTIGHPTWMMRSSVYFNLGGYRDLAPAEDYDFLLRCLKHKLRIGMIAEPLLKFRTQITSGGTALENGLVQINE